VSFVLDNSIALAWCFQDEHTPTILDLLDRVTESGAFAPVLWPLEALNGLFAAERRRRLDVAQRMSLGRFLRALPIRLDTETADQAWDGTARLAEQFRLTVYDAAYLELAQRRRLPLASLDKDLRHAAVATGVEILGQP
jgi:predicted nucleic acid-binding protein